MTTQLLPFCYSGWYIGQVNNAAYSNCQHTNFQGKLSIKLKTFQKVLRMDDQIKRFFFQLLNSKNLTGGSLLHTTDIILQTIINVNNLQWSLLYGLAETATLRCKSSCYILTKVFNLLLRNTINVFINAAAGDISEYHSPRGFFQDLFGVLGDNDDSQMSREQIV